MVRSLSLQVCTTPKEMTYWRTYLISIKGILPYHNVYDVDGWTISSIHRGKLIVKYKSDASASRRWCLIYWTWKPWLGTSCADVPLEVWMWHCSYVRSGRINRFTSKFKMSDSLSITCEDENLRAANAFRYQQTLTLTKAMPYAIFKRQNIWISYNMPHSVVGFKMSSHNESIPFPSHGRLV